MLRYLISKRYIYLDKNNVNSCLCFVAYVLSSFETSMDAKAMVMLDGAAASQQARYIVPVQ